MKKGGRACAGTARSNFRLRKFVGPMPRGRVIYLRSPALILEAQVRFPPRRQFAALLIPMDHRGFVAPVSQLAHGLHVGARDHEFLHCRFAVPESAGPKSVAAIAEQLRRQVPLRPARLPPGPQSVPRKHRQKSPRSQPQPSDGHKRHFAMVAQQPQTWIVRGKMDCQGNRRSRGAAPFCTGVHTFAQGLPQNSIDAMARKTYCAPRLNREA